MILVFILTGWSVDQIQPLVDVKIELVDGSAPDSAGPVDQDQIIAGLVPFLLPLFVSALNFHHGAVIKDFCVLMFIDLQCIIEISGLAIRDLRIKTFVGYGSVGSKMMLFHLAESHVIQECLLPFSSLSISLFIIPSLEIVKAENF